MRCLILYQRKQLARSWASTSWETKKNELSLDPVRNKKRLSLDSARNKKGQPRWWALSHNYKWSFRAWKNVWPITYARRVSADGGAPTVCMFGPFHRETTIYTLQDGYKPNSGLFPMFLADSSDKRVHVTNRRDIERLEYPSHMIIVLDMN